VWIPCSGVVQPEVSCYRRSAEFRSRTPSLTTDCGTDCELHRNGEQPCAKGDDGYATGSTLHRGSSFDVDEGHLAQDRRLLRGSRFRPCLRNPTHRALPPLEDCQYITIWDQSTYVDCGQASRWERQAPYGYRSGITAGLHLPAAGISCSSPTPTRRPARHRHRPGNCWKTSTCSPPHAQAAAFELCTHIDPPAHEQSSLTPANAKRFAGPDGMTRWEVGRQMGLSECDVALRLQRGMRKLGCGSTYEVGLRAIRLGMIERSFSLRQRRIYQ
jgi:hypothetical protein